MWCMMLIGLFYSHIFENPHESDDSVITYFRSTFLWDEYTVSREHAPCWTAPKVPFTNMVEDMGK